MDRAEQSCGPRTEIVRTEGVRISRCTCGTLHVSFTRNGLTMQLTEEHFDEAAQAMALARSLIRHDAPRPVQARVVRSDGGPFVGLSYPSPKKAPQN
jgi:hypothetical protein